MSGYQNGSNWWDLSPKGEPETTGVVSPEGENLYVPERFLGAFADLGVKLDLGNSLLHGINSHHRRRQAALEKVTRVPLKASGVATIGTAAINAVKVGGPDQGYKLLLRNISIQPAPGATNANFTSAMYAVYVGTPLEVGTSGAASTPSGYGQNPGDLVDVAGAGSYFGWARTYSNEQIEVDFGQLLYVAVAEAAADPFVVTAYVQQVPTGTRSYLED